MKNAYYYKSLIATLLVYCAALAGVVYVVYRAGITGFLILFVIIAGFLCSFYGIFGKSREPGERKS